MGYGSSIFVGQIAFGSETGSIFDWMFLNDSIKIENVNFLFWNSFFPEWEQRLYLQPCNESDGNSYCIRVHWKGKQKSIKACSASVHVLM